VAPAAVSIPAVGSSAWRGSGGQNFDRVRDKGTRLWRRWRSGDKESKLDRWRPPQLLPDSAEMQAGKVPGGQVDFGQFVGASLASTSENVRTLLRKE
jgi:hypothetical protein